MSCKCRNLVALLSLSSMLWACQQDTANPAAEATSTEAKSMQTESSMAEASADLVDTEFNPNLGRYIETLASDAFEGRSPASAGEEKTIAFIRDGFKNAGWEPAVNGSYFQPVPLVEITAEATSPVRMSGPEGDFDLAIGDDAITWTKRVTESVAVNDSEVVFVGYGVVAPEYGWNDYANVDVSGKTVIILVNDPGFATGDEELFRGRTMTYYGRWNYKLEEAARQGAAMALIVHETAAAGYGYDVVTGSWSGAQFDLVRDDKNRGRVAVEGWLSNAAAQRVLTAAGEDLEALSEAAKQRGFQAKPLSLTASASVQNRLRESESNNVVAILPGSERPDEYIIYTAHWDHLGINESVDGDQIFNGAQDNASGTAALMAIAENIAQGPRPKRSIVLAAVTAEESGLLGSRFLAENSPFPMGQIVAGVNMDALNISGPMRDLIVVGYGNSELEPMVEQLAAEQNRRVEPNPAPEKGFYYRSDHFNFAKRGVPMLYAKGGVDHFEKGKSYGQEQNSAYVHDRYHKPADEYGDWWDLRGMSQDLFIFQRLGLQLANSEQWPNWYEGNEFRALRDASRAESMQPQ